LYTFYFFAYKIVPIICCTCTLSYLPLAKLELILPLSMVTSIIS